MGIDFQALQALQWAALKSNGLGDVATLGRQALVVSASDLKRCGISGSSGMSSPYCEEFLKVNLGARCVDSFDISDFEGCSFVADFNKPLEHHRQYDTVIDSGCLEHIFNVPQALRNIANLCRDGGQILHFLPANNECGHGFWQFSPELFFSVYSSVNGYSATEVFLIDRQSAESVWYEVIPPQDGRRVIVWSDVPVFVLCRTVKLGPTHHEDVQQSDYVFAWGRADSNQASTEAPAPSPAAGVLRAAFKRIRIANSINKALKSGFSLHPNGLRRNRSLVRRSVAELLKRKPLDS